MAKQIYLPFGVKGIEQNFPQRIIFFILRLKWNWKNLLTIIILSVNILTESITGHWILGGGIERFYFVTPEDMVLNSFEKKVFLTNYDR